MTREYNQRHTIKKIFDNTAKTFIYKTSIKPEIIYIDSIIDKKINTRKESLEYTNNEVRALTEFGAARVMRETPFLLLNQYSKLFDNYKIKKSDIQLIIESIDRQAKYIETMTNRDNTEFSGAENGDTGDLLYDEWMINDYEYFLREFYEKINIIKERMKALYYTSRVQSKKFWIPTIISIISLIIGLLGIFIK
jgi:hypothetical protein